MFGLNFEKEFSFLKYDGRCIKKWHYAVLLQDTCASGNHVQVETKV